MRPLRDWKLFPCQLRARCGRVRSLELAPFFEEVGNGHDTNVCSVQTFVQTFAQTNTEFSTNVCNKPSYQRLYMEHPLAQAAVAMPNGDTEISTMAEPVTLKRLVQGSRYEAQRYEASTCPL